MSKIYQCNEFTSNSVIALILLYFTKFNSFGGQLHQQTCQHC